ncbi:MAG: hypothetical protein K6G78_01375 [bacterium]|nr:hypothetical protein [bacterium]
MAEKGNGQSRAEEFVQLFTSLERAIRADYNLNDGITTPLRWLVRNHDEFAKYKRDINQIIDIRNMLQHSPKYDDEYVVEPSEEMLDTLKKISDKVLHPPRVIDAATPISRLCWRSMDDLVRPALIEMRDRGYTFVPILDNGVVVGLFSENSLLSYLIDEEAVGIEASTRFSDISQVLALEGRVCEFFAFAGRNMLLIDVDNRFEKARASGRCLGMVFVTQSGNPKEPLLGVLTEWDVDRTF